MSAKVYLKKNWRKKFAQNKMADFFEAVGSSKFWNLAPCEDLLAGADNVLLEKVVKQIDADEINILIAGAGDVCHILKTLAMFRRKNITKKLHVRVKMLN